MIFMSNSVHGIHHITAIASDPIQTVNFYSKVLGLRLVKKTVNQDDTATYHLFFGDTTGEPGMDLTFFTFKPAMQGRRGAGQVTVISLAVPQDSLEFWLARFTHLKIKHEAVHESFGAQRIIFYDHDDQRLELVGVGDELATMEGQIWTKEISKENAIRAFYSARLTIPKPEYVEPILTILGYVKGSSEGNLTQYALADASRAAFLEVESDSYELGMGAAGTVHHIAFAVDDEKHELELRHLLIEIGLYPTEVINRYYFKSVYFRTPGGILFELATMGPGFTADEKESELGTHLSLPPFLEEQRKEIEKNLVEI